MRGIQIGGITDRVTDRRMEHVLTHTGPISRIGRKDLSQIQYHLPGTGQFVTAQLFGFFDEGGRTGQFQ